MFINGLQKLTLVDYPGHCACTVFIAGCNFRCPWCHNSELIPKDAPQFMEDREFLSFLDKRRGVLDGVCFTGGEPLLDPETPELIRKVKALGYPVKLDTNGSFPKRLKELVNEGLLDYVAMDIKNSKALYAETIGLPQLNMAAVEESAAFLKEGHVPYEFRTTVIKEFFNEDAFKDIGSWIGPCENYYLQAFTDRDSVVYEGFSAPEKEEMLKYAEILNSFGVKAKLRGL